MRWSDILRTWKLWVPLLCAAVAAFGVGITVSDDDGDNVPDHVVIQRHFKKVDPPGPVGPITVDTDNQITPHEEAALEQADKVKPADQPDVHEDMRDETPPGVTQAEVNAGVEKTEALAADTLGPPMPPAGAQAYSCPNHIVRNRSTVNGPRVGSALHFTVSPPGSMDSIINLFDTSSFGASSNKIIELNGRCRTLVPDTEKAWAQGAANSAYFSIEIVTNDLSKAQWLAAPIIKNGTLAAIVRDWNRSVGAPLKLVDPSGCTWTPGVVDHDRLECGNTHWDVGKNFPWTKFMRDVRRGVCDRKCDLRHKHHAVHRQLRRNHCFTSQRTSRCPKLKKRNATVHRRASIEHITL